MRLIAAYGAIFPLLVVAGACLFALVCLCLLVSAGYGYLRDLKGVKPAKIIEATK